MAKKLIPCRACEKEIAPSAEVCPHCGADCPNEDVYMVTVAVEYIGTVAVRVIWCGILAALWFFHEEIIVWFYFTFLPWLYLR